MGTRHDVISSVTISRFRSIVRSTLDLDERPLFLVGPNGAGKSSLIDGILAISEAAHVPLGHVIGRRGGYQATRNRTAGTVGAPAQMGFRAQVTGNDGTRGEFVGHLAFTIGGSKADDREFEVVRESAEIHYANGEAAGYDRGSSLETFGFDVTPTIEHDALLFPNVAGDPILRPLQREIRGASAVSIDPARMREPARSDSDPTAYLAPDGANAPGVYRALQRSAPLREAELVRFLGAIAADVVGVTPKRLGRGFDTFEFEQRWRDEKGIDRTLRLSPSDMSDGTLRAFGILLALEQEPAPPLLAIEEIESAIHPGALRVLIDALDLANGRSQLVVSTHSPEVLGHSRIMPEQIRIVRRDHGRTAVHHLRSDSADVIRRHLASAGELLTSNSLISGDEVSNHEMFASAAS